MTINHITQAQLAVQLQLLCCLIPETTHEKLCGYMISFISNKPSEKSRHLG